MDKTGRGGESVKVVHSERGFREWFLSNYQNLGYDKILESYLTKTPDFIMLKGDKRVKIELELFSKNARAHKINEVDEVVCVRESCADVPWPVIEVKEVRYRRIKKRRIKKPTKSKIIRVSKENHDWLEKHKGVTEFFGDVVERLVKTYEKGGLPSSSLQREI